MRKDYIMPHCDGQSPFWNDTKWAEPWDEASLCNQGIFTLPISWMGDITSELKGKLMCPKCQAKLGSYDWCGGKDRNIGQRFLKMGQLDKDLDI